MRPSRFASWSGPLALLLLAGLAHAAPQRAVRERSLLTAPRNEVPPSWTEAAPLLAPAYRYAFAQTEDELYVLTMGGFYRYDLGADSWETLTQVPRPLQMQGMVHHAGKLYAAGGMDDGLTQELFIYDIATDVWTEGASMPAWSYGSAAGVHDGRIFVVSGSSGGQLAIYDIAAGTWSLGPNPPVSYRIGGHTQVGQYLFLIGHLGANGNTISRRLDMETVTWSTGPTWTPGRADFALASDGATLYALGGRVWNQSNPSAEVYELDFAAWPAGQWTRSSLPDLPFARCSNQAGFFADGRLWCTGGRDASSVPILEHLFLELDPASLGDPTRAVWR